LRIFGDNSELNLPADKVRLLGHILRATDCRIITSEKLNAATMKIPGILESKKYQDILCKIFLLRDGQYSYDLRSRKGSDLDASDLDLNMPSGHHCGYQAVTGVNQHEGPVIERTQITEPINELQKKELPRDTHLSAYVMAVNNHLLGRKADLEGTLGLEWQAYSPQGYPLYACKI
jgi:hypothetical protein